MSHKAYTKLASIHLRDSNYHMCMMGHKGQLAPCCCAMGTMIKKSYHGILKAVQLFRFKNFEHLLGSGGNHNLRPGCRCHLAGTFHTPAIGAFRRDCTCTFPESAVPIMAKFLCPHSRCFGSCFVAIFLMYLECFLAFLSSQPHPHPHQSSSSTQFSQE